MLGTVKIQVWRGSFTCLLLCRLVESRRCRPILGKSACEGMGVVEIKDSDAIWQPHTSGGQVFFLGGITKCKGHSTSVKANTLDLFYVSGPEEEW